MSLPENIHEVKIRALVFWCTPENAEWRIKLTRDEEKKRRRKGEKVIPAIQIPVTRSSYDPELAYQISSVFNDRYYPIFSSIVAEDCTLSHTVYVYVNTQFVPKKYNPKTKTWTDGDEDVHCLPDGYTDQESN